MVVSEKIYCPNVLAISGTGRNVGKTTLACSIIKRMDQEERITAIKITPHFHEVDYKSKVTGKPRAYVIYRENRIDRAKDSSKMLAAGAGKVYYIQTSDKNLSEVWGALTALIDQKNPVIIESGGINEFIEPGISVFLIDPDQKMQEMTDHKNYTLMISSNEEFESLLTGISYSDGLWKFLKKYD